MIFDCAIIGAGPAGSSAALVLGRAKRNVLLCDDNRPRNAVTHETHGYLTRDRIEPAEFRSIARNEISRYPSVIFKDTRVSSLTKNAELFHLELQGGETFEARTVILATGLRETLPEIRGIHDFYGKSLFSCPYCDGWESRDRPLALIVENEHIFHMAKLVYNWSTDLLVCTNGHTNLTPEQKQLLQRKGIAINEQPITELVGVGDQLRQIVFQDGSSVPRVRGFVGTQLTPASPFAAELGCATNEQHNIVIDPFGRTSVQGLYAAGELALPSQLILAAADGTRAAIGVNMDLIERDFTT